MMSNLGSFKILIHEYIPRLNIRRETFSDDHQQEEAKSKTYTRREDNDVKDYLCNSGKNFDILSTLNSPRLTPVSYLHTHELLSTRTVQRIARYQ